MRGGNNRKGVALECLLCDLGRGGIYEVMWGRKDKEKRGERRKGGKGGAALPFMGLGVPPGTHFP